MRVAIPRALVPLLKPARYKGAYGGRGSAKSHTFAQMAVIANYTKSARGVCIREVQNSIKDSVKQLIEDKIASLGLGPFFEVTRDEIREHMSGNYCRCTGYQAIVDAVETTLAARRADRASHRLVDKASACRSSVGPLAVGMALVD